MNIYKIEITPWGDSVYLSHERLYSENQVKFMINSATNIISVAVKIESIFATFDDIIERLIAHYGFQKFEFTATVGIDYDAKFENGEWKND